MKEVWEKELKKIRNKETNKDKGGLTSSHHMAAELAVRRMRAFLKSMRKQRYIIDKIDNKKLKLTAQRTMIDFSRHGSNMFSIRQ